MIDDMEGIYDCASQAHAAGRRRGVDDLLRSAMNRLGRISVEHEKSGNVSAFHAAEACCKALGDAAELIRSRDKAINR